VAFQYTLEQCAKAANGMRHQVRWFMEPFGYAEGQPGGARRQEEAAAPIC